MKEPTNHRTSEVYNEPTNQRTNEPTNQQTSEATNPHKAIENQWDLFQVYVPNPALVSILIGDVISVCDRFMVTENRSRPTY